MEHSCLIQTLEKKKHHITKTCKNDPPSTKITTRNRIICQNNRTFSPTTWDYLPI